RILALYLHLPEDFTTTYVATFDYPGPAFRDQQLTPNFREILTPLTVQHFKIHGLLSRLTRDQATLDVTMPLLGGLTPRYRRLMEEHVPEADLLICAHPWMFPFLPSEPRLPRIYDSQNCEAAVKGPLLDRTLTGRYLASRVRKTERRAALGSRLILACSDEDAQAFQELYGVQPENITLVPNGVDCRVIVPPDDRLKEDSRAKLGVSGAEFAIFVGSNYVPNLEAVEFIVSQMAPELPDVQFGIIGGAGSMFKERHPDRSLPENVRLFGFVKPDELWDFYRAADLALNPMAKGSGTNIKMLDYMAAGLPILTTLKGARGILGVSGEHWITAPLDGFVSELQRLASAKEAMRKIGEHGRSLVESRYDWSRIAESLAESLRPLARPG
ncbi:glycosyltransferase family 4 protein, partial [Candidatus Sumerlaeota bacterium]|nr:glycosyltransferase family 4 protein [Candidatus Sumerlaeota bacterium]